MKHFTVHRTFLWLLISFQSQVLSLWLIIFDKEMLLPLICLKWIHSHPPVLDFHQYTHQLSVVRDGRGNWFGPIKNVRAFEDIVICFHEDPVIRDERTTWRCWCGEQDIKDDTKREIFRGRQMATQYQHSKGRGKSQAKSTLRKSREDERHRLHG